MSCLTNPLGHLFGIQSLFTFLLNPLGQLPAASGLHLSRVGVKAQSLSGTLGVDVENVEPVSELELSFLSELLEPESELPEPLSLESSELEDFANTRLPAVIKRG